MKKVNYSTTKNELVRIGLPEETKSYKPISHEQLIDLTLNSIQNAGFELEKEWYDASSDKQIATGHYAIKNIADKEMQLSIAWQNSLNKMVSLKFALGLHVFVCYNGACSGDMGAFKRKHTGDVQEFTPKTIEEYIRTAGEAFAEMQKQRDIMKEIQLTKKVKAELIGRMYLEEEFIESVQLNIIKRELMKPTYDYGAPNSLWELYQFTTYAMKSTPPAFWMKNHIAAHSFFVNEAGIIVPEKVLVTAEGEEIPANQVNMYEVPGFVPESINDEGLKAGSGAIEIDNPIEDIEEDKPIIGVSQVDHSAMLDIPGDSKLDINPSVDERDELKSVPEDIRMYPVTPEECIPPTTENSTTEYEDLQ